MKNFPLLQQMRAERQRREDAVTAPYREELDQFHALVTRLKASLRALEKVVGSEIGRHVMAEIAHGLSGELRRHIFEALAKTAPVEPVFTLRLPTDVLRFMDPKSMESEVLRRYVYETLPSMGVRVDTKPDDMVTIMDIRIPELGYRRAMSQVHAFQ